MINLTTTVFVVSVFIFVVVLLIIIFVYNANFKNLDNRVKYLEESSIAVDASGNVWVANYKTKNIMKLSPSGAVLGIFKVGDKKPVRKPK